MEHHLHNLSKILHETRLTQEESARLRARLTTYTLEHPIKEHLPLYQRALEHGMRIALSTFLFMIFVGGSVSVIADNALPGDPLYSFKVHVNEEVKGAFLSTPAKKAAYQTNRIQERLNEIKTLAESNALTPEKQQSAKAAIDDHLTELNTELQKADPNAALAVTDTLKATLTANKDAVTADTNTNLSDPDKAQVIGTYDSALQDVSNQQVQIISKQVDAITNDILTTTPTPVSDDFNATATTENTSTTNTPPPITPVAP